MAEMLKGVNVDNLPCLRKTRYRAEAPGAQGELLLYNTANGAFVQLEGAARELWEREAWSRDGGDEAMRAATETLERLGFLTELSAEDELEACRAAFDEQRADATSMTISIVPTYVCNFRCPYCYELGHNKTPGKMDGSQVDSIVRFVQGRHACDGFESLNVQWYGGDPSLALDVVEGLSGKLVSWCDAEGIAYDAVMLTNANVIGEAEAQLIASCRVSSVMLTIDGPEEVHNKRRVAANGSNSYERTIQAARFLRARGVQCWANMNADKVNLPLYESLREQLEREEGIMLTFGKLNDYGHFFGSEPFCRPEFDLFDHEEFFEAQFKELAKRPHTAEEMRELLRPPRRFCSGQANNYFVIDLLGDVYACDGWVGEKSHVRFNLHDDPATWKLHEVSFDPTRDERCSECWLLPVCLGSCIWERELSGMPCHPFKTTMGDYLRLYRDCLDAPFDGADVTVLAEAG